MPDDKKAAAAATVAAPINQAEVDAKISFIGARLREKSTYGGLAVALGFGVAVFHGHIDPSTTAGAIESIGLGVGALIGIFLPEKGSPVGTVNPVGMGMFALALFASAIVSFAPAHAQTAPIVTKSQPVYNVAPSGLDAIFKGYPYGSSGLFFGIFTQAGGGSVNGSVAGVGSASLTSTQAGVGGTIGYAWGAKNSPVAVSIEGDFGWTNVNGGSQGLSLEGPLAFEQRFVIFTPLANMLSLLPNLPSLGTLPPFSALPAGVTASNTQIGLMAGVDENDISPNFPGLAANKEWRVAPMIGLVSMEQLSNGTAMRVWLKTIFPDKSVCIGPAGGNACAGLGQQVQAGVGIYF